MRNFNNYSDDDIIQEWNEGNDSNTDILDLFMVEDFATVNGLISRGLKH